MSAREKILRYYRASGEDEVASKLLDLAEQVLRSRKYKVSSFIDPFGLSVAETIIAHYDHLQLVANGGYQGAERVKAAFIHDEFLGNTDYGITAVEAEWDSRYYDISHRDVLGALLGLGVKREVIGDIIMKPSGCQIILDAELTEFIIQNLSTIGSASVQLSKIELTDIAPKQEKVKEIRATAASLRLDAVAALGFSTSRTKMAEDISAGKVKVNWQDAKSSSQSVKVGDIISIRGRGRVEVSEILGQTKKGRTSILLKRFI